MKTKLIIGVALMFCLSSLTIFADPCPSPWHKEYQGTCCSTHPNFNTAYDRAWECADEMCLDCPDNCYCVFEEYYSVVPCGTMLCYKYCVKVFFCCWYGN